VPVAVSVAVAAVKMKCCHLPPRAHLFGSTIPAHAHTAFSTCYVATPSKAVGSNPIRGTDVHVR
jgi:hypothetical protein